MSDLQDFHAETLPLDGLRLIEASAGTGKTFNLAGLYLRLIAEENASVRNILVMTFTRAATQELRERIRSRLARAALIAHDRQQADPDNPEDAFTCRILDKFDDHDPQKQLTRRLAEAAGRVDEATIVTIHGFAKRAATENAFESALAFDRGEPVDDPEIHRQMAADYWREQVFATDSTDDTVLNFWSDAEALYQDIRVILDKPHARLLQASQAHIDHLLDQLDKLWPQTRQPLTELLCQLWEHGLLKKGSLKSALEADNDPQVTMAQLDASIQQALANRRVPLMAPWAATLATPETQLNQKKKLDDYLDSFQQLQPVLDILAELQPLAYTLAIQHAAADIQQRTLDYKAEQRLYSYDDLIAALHQALHEPRTGDRLADALHQRWPYALVDEFQDTDPLQYANLHRIYLDKPRDYGALLLIGDPKQAIYGFRGGDIYAYLAAAQAAGQQRYTLARNFRSTQSLLNAIEALYRQPDTQPFRVAAIDFPSIQAGRTDGDRRLIHTADGSELAALTIWQLEGNVKKHKNGNISNPRKKHDESLLRQKTVETIARLLHTDDIQWQDADNQRKAIRPHDIAILVNRNHQAEELQTALSMAGIRAVCQQQASVYGSAEAAELQLLLRAMLEPDDARAVRAAQTGLLLGKRLADLIALADDDQALQQAVAQFHELHEDWRRRGILSALEKLLIQAAPRILALTDGERRMTNFLQLGELLAHTEAETFGMASLLHRLDEQVEDTREGTSGQNESNQLRLESDAGLVRISTVHAAKGLEYPIVFMPFAPWLGQWSQNKGPHKPPLVFHKSEYSDDHTPNNPAWIDLTGTRQDHIDQAVTEWQSEALRLLYVALTRAEQALFLGWREPSSDKNPGALSDLLYRQTAPPGLAMQQLVARHSDCMALERLNSEQYSPHIPSAPLPSTDSLGPARQQLPQPRPRWSTYSFSRLAHAPVVETGTVELPEAGAMDEATPATSVLPPPEDDPAVPELDSRLGGVSFGSAVHDLLETQLQPQPRELASWPMPGQEPNSAQQQLVYETLRRYGLIADDTRDPRIQDTTQLVARTLHTPLPRIGTLAALPSQQIRTEMEFMFRMDGNQLGKLVQTLHEHGYLNTALGGHANQTLYGLMQGFIDLTVEMQGRYYIIDYKTNRLGDTVSAYQGPALQKAISRAHYDLQYLIYAVALQRHLRRSLGRQYDPTFHLGGVQYLFVRAMDGQSDTGIFTDALDPELIQELDVLFARPMAYYP